MMGIRISCVALNEKLVGLAIVAVAVTVLWLVGGTTPAAAQALDPPGSDNIADAPELEGLPVSVVGTGGPNLATAEPGEPECWPGDRFSGHESLWYKWTAPTDAIVTFDVPSRIWGDAIGIYTSDVDAPTVTDLNEVICELGNPSFALVNVTAGTTYWIQMNITFVDPSAEVPLVISPLRNNGAIAVTIEAAGAPLPPAWTVTVSSNACDFTTTQTVEPIPESTTITLADLPVVNPGTGEICGYSSSVEPVEAWAESGSEPPFAPAKFTSLEEPTSSIVYTFDPSPANDDLANAELISGLPVTVTGTLVGSTVEPDEPRCVVNVFPRWSLWYEWTAPASGTVDVTTSPGLLTASVYTSGVADPTAADLTPAGNDACGFIDASFPATAGETYWIQFSTYDNQVSGEVTLTLDAGEQGPFGPNLVPGVIEAEDFDFGAEGEAYSDSEQENTGLARGGDYRDSGVDIYPTRTPGETGWVIGHTRQGEWLEYTVTVEATRSIDISARVATGIDAPGALQLDVDGSTVATVGVTDTGGWWSWQEVPLATVELAGNRNHVVRLTWISDDPNVEPQINVDRIIFAEPAPGACGGTIQQAEFARLVGDLQTVSTENPAGINGGDIAITSGPNLANTYRLDATNPFAEFCFTTTELDQYEVGVRVQAPDSRSDSYWVQVDDADPVLWHIGAQGAQLNPIFTRVLDSTASGRPAMQVNLEPGEHRVRFYHREGGVLLDSVGLFRNLVDVPPPAASCSNPLHVEAEWGTLSGNMAAQPDPTATFNRYVANDPAVPSAYTFDPGNDDWVEYCVRVPEAGNWRLAATMIAPTSKSNSFYVQVDDNEPEAWHPRVTDAWAVRTKPGAYVLPAGDITVRFSAREAGTLLDSFSLIPA